MREKGWEEERGGKGVRGEGREDEGREEEERKGQGY